MNEIIEYAISKLDLIILRDDKIKKSGFLSNNHIIIKGGLDEKEEELILLHEIAHYLISHCKEIYIDEWISNIISCWICTNPVCNSRSAFIKMLEESSL